MHKFLLFVVVFVSFSLVHAGERGSATGLAVPRFVSLKFDKVNLRKGPGEKYPIVWIYKQKGYPMEVTAEFENWRRIRDIDGTEGWVRENLIAGNRNVVVNLNNYLQPNPEYEKRSRELVIFRYPDELSYPMVRVELGVVAKLKSCDNEWCKLKIDDITGWARKSNLWGVYPEEMVK